MPAAAPAPIPTLTTAERALIRYEFMCRFGQAPLLADGIWLRTWKSGLLKGQPKLPPVVAALQQRGLVTVVPGGATAYHGYRAMFTEAGMAALRLMAGDRRALDPDAYAHLRHELGVDAAAAAGTAADGKARGA